VWGKVRLKPASAVLSYRFGLRFGWSRLLLTAIESIRDWYKSQPPWVRRVNLSSSLLFALALLVGLTKSGSEFRAIAWHYHNGDRVTVNGITFPVYYWYAPEGARDRFHVLDQPGPLRPTEDKFAMFSINGRRDKDDAGTPQELVEREMRRGSSWDLSRFQWNIRSQTLECMQEHDSRPSWSIIFCFGDEPIYSVFFNGNDDALDKFKRTISQAK
jgi:hypothetical protein